MVKGRVERDSASHVQSHKLPNIGYHVLYFAGCVYCGFVPKASIAAMPKRNRLSNPLIVLRLAQSSCEHVPKSQISSPI
eukprot:5939356-Amphidinium_carterae.2